MGLEIEEWIRLKINFFSVVTPFIGVKLPLPSASRHISKLMLKMATCEMSKNVDS
jgi:hypothetical protein